jgi:hypothetical protein
MLHIPLAEELFPLFFGGTRDEKLSVIRAQVGTYILDHSAGLPPIVLFLSDVDLHGMDLATKDASASELHDLDLRPAVNHHYGW